MKADVSGVSSLDLNLAGRCVVGDMLTRSAEQFPERIAIKDSQGSVTYAELERTANAVGRGLLELGLRRQEPVGFIMGNSWQFMATYYGCAKAGLISLPINLAQAPDEIRFCLADAEVGTIVVDDAFLPILEQIIGELPQVTRVVVRGEHPEQIGGIDTVSWDEIASGDGSLLEVEVDDRDILQCLYSSGTTSRPKGVLTSHVSVVVACLTTAITAGHKWGNEPSVFGVIVPMFHTTALNVLTMPTLATGGTVVALPGFEPDQFIDSLENDGLTHIMLLPHMYELLLQNPRTQGKSYDSVQFCMYAMAQMPEQRIKRIKELFPNGHALLGSGMTECVPPTVFQFPEHEFTATASWGPPVATVDTRIIGPDGELLPRGEHGEIVYRGAQVMQGYWNRTEVNNEVFRGGWLRTGDLGYKDDEGVIWFTDRSKDMIKSGGENVSSMEVERTILEHPHIQDCGVIGVADERWGEAVTAFVVTDGSDVTAADVIKHCKERLGGFKVPKRVEIVEALPKTATGKVQKHELRKLA
ncbi:class I adenylate-forming enzyme family protein [Blastococcus sp. Marseille-P5729]|uniref:class I adenylate-forming enzyme family protein n=1 Tax=Blastococcus sp. Marseille-P5729 TaxID=2086582 RepID=UPI00131C200F|nr:class I adenylate-forming enzyme family protein [Blastococcus sp. Marseille-P5729]